MASGGGKYKWTDESHGQNDTAELLGDILWNLRPGNFEFTAIKAMHMPACDHQWESRTKQMMVVLVLPPRPQILIDCESDSKSEDDHIHFLQEPSHFAIQALLDYYEAEETIGLVRCSVCDVVNAHAQAKPRFEFTSDIIIFRINRYEVIDGGN